MNQFSTRAEPLGDCCHKLLTAEEMTSTTLTVILVLIGIALLLAPFNMTVDRKIRETFDKEYREYRRWRNSLPRLVRNVPDPPEGVTRDPVESCAWYTAFNEYAVVAAHEDRQSLVVYAPDDLWRPGCSPAMNIARTYDALFGHSDAENVILAPGTINSHPRIVGRLHNIPQGLRLHRSRIGPLASLTLPILNIQPSIDPSWTLLRRDREYHLLSLFQMWALQTLNAIVFCHSRSVYLVDFSVKQVWIQSDFSAALTGFVTAALPAEEWMYLDNDNTKPQRTREFGWSRKKQRWFPIQDHLIGERAKEDISDSHYELHRWPPENITLPEGQEGEWHLHPELNDHIEDTRDLSINWPTTCTIRDPNDDICCSLVKADLFDWATFVFRLMTNGFSKNDPRYDSESRQVDWKEISTLR